MELDCKNSFSFMFENIPNKMFRKLKKKSKYGLSDDCYFVSTKRYPAAVAHEPTPHH